MLIIDGTVTITTLLFHGKNHFRNKNLEKLYRKYLQRLNQDNLRTYILLQLITSIGFIIAALIINMVTFWFGSCSMTLETLVIRSHLTAIFD